MKPFFSLFCKALPAFSFLCSGGAFEEEVFAQGIDSEETIAPLSVVGEGIDSEEAITPLSMVGEGVDSEETITPLSVVGEKKGKESKFDSPSVVPWPKRAYFSYLMNNKCWLNVPNYGTASVVFAPEWRGGGFLPMLDLRGHLTEQHQFASNIGFVGRYISSSPTAPQIIGFNIYWDWREGCYGPFNQIGLGFELLNSWWDFRANGTILVGDYCRGKQCIFRYPGNYILIHKGWENPDYFANIEFGGVAAKAKWGSIYLAMGPYFLKGKCSGAIWGGEFRMRPQITDYLAIDVRYNYDSLFRSSVQAEFIFSIPLYSIYKARKWGDLTDDQIYRRVERLDVIPLCRGSCWTES